MRVKRLLGPAATLCSCSRSQLSAKTCPSACQNRIPRVMRAHAPFPFRLAYRSIYLSEVAPQHHASPASPFRLAMCGIFFSLSRNAYVAPDPETERLLRNRGPDSIGTHQILLPPDAGFEQDNGARGGLYANFISTVLALRGASVVEQPLRDDASGSVLCWNGEAWALGSTDITGNDSQHVFASLLASSSSEVVSERSSSIDRVTTAVAAIRGPYALVYYDAKNGYLYYARDCLARRSLLRASISTDSLILSSVCNSSRAEVEVDGLYVLDLATAWTNLDLPLHATHIPWRIRSEQRYSDTGVLERWSDYCTMPFCRVHRKQKY